MGFIKAFSGAIGGSFADQWKDFYSIPNGLASTVGICFATPNTSNLRRSSNTKSNNGIITNGSLILVPEGYALVTMENGAITGYVSEPGGYQWNSDELNSESFFAGDNILATLTRQSWDRFKFGGIPATTQVGIFVNVKEIPGLKFGTQGGIYWNDAYFNAQVGAIAYGTYSLRITNPIQFLKTFVPAEYYSNPNALFDFSDYNNSAVTQLFNEVVGSLSAAFSSYTNDASKGNRITAIQRDAIGFANSLSSVIEHNYHWYDDRGLKLDKAALISINYDAITKTLLAKVQQADALMGARGNSNLQASLADGLEAAGQNPGDGALGMGFMGLGLQGASIAAGALQQTTQTQTSVPEDPFEKLTKMKTLLDNGIITQDDFNSAKKKLLGL